MKRIQGTDGVRGEVCSSTKSEVSGLTPQEAFLQKGKLTEHFFELYTYALAQYFKEIGFLEENRKVVIGWDPRDKTTIFTEAAIRGLLRHDLEVITTGISPTPMVSFATIYLNAAFGVMITASHNPADQNGLKAFFGFSGLKPLEKDDERITEIFLQTAYADIVRMPIQGRRTTKEDDIKNVYVSYCRSFLKRQPELHYRHLLVDNANGSYSLLSRRVFSKQDEIEVTSVNTYQKGIINNLCGVTYYERVKEISFREINDLNSRFSQIPLLRRLMKEAEKIADDLLSGEKMISGVVFDGDGDRIFWLEMDYPRRRILVIGGDEIAANLITEKSSGETIYYINTIESDSNTLAYAKEHGCETMVTSVGDKWLIVEMVRKTIQHLLEQCEKDEAYKTETLTKMQDIESSAALSLLYRDVVLRYQDMLESRGRYLVNRKFIGSESSGHVMFSRVLKTNRKTYVPLFTGNAMEIAAEFSKVLPVNMSRHGLVNYPMKLALPFKEGLKDTFYLYYTKKELLKNGGSLFEELKVKVPQLVAELSSNEFSAKLCSIKGDDDVLYFSLKNNEGVNLNVFIRNSGTEAKTGFSIRGDKKHEAFLVNLVEKTMDYVDASLRDSESPHFQFGLKVLNSIRQEGEVSLEFIRDLGNGVSVERIQKEFLYSEGNIDTNSGSISLSAKGVRLLERFLPVC